MSRPAPELTVLTVSTHARLARFIQREIDLRGHTAIIAENADEARAMTGAALLDIILLDSISMAPDSLELARTLLSIRNIAILMLVSSVEDITRARASGVEVRGYLLQPITTQRLWSGIWDAIAAHSRPQVFAWRAQSGTPDAFNKLLGLAAFHPDALGGNLDVAV